MQVAVLIWPYIGALWERSLYDTHDPNTRWWGLRKKKKEDVTPLPPNIAISIRNLGKEFTRRSFTGKKTVVTAISDLSVDIPSHGIFVLLGPNGCVISSSLPA